MSSTVIGADSQFIYINDDSGVVTKVPIGSGITNFSQLSGQATQAQLATPTPTWVNVKTFGAKGDAQKVTDASSSAGNTVTSATANFKQADVGKICWGIENASGLARVTQGTISSVNSATACHVTSSNFQNGYSNLTFIWGTDDTLALIAACRAAIPTFTSEIANTAQLNPTALNIYCPAGGYIFSRLPFDFVAQGYVYEGPGIQGDGSGSTFFYPTPSYDFTTTHANQGMLIANSFNLGSNWTGGFTVDGSNFAYSGATAYYGIQLSGRAVRDITAINFNGLGAAVLSTVTYVENCIAVGNNIVGWVFSGGSSCTVVGGLFSNCNPYSAEVVNYNNVTVAGTISFHGTTFDEPGINVIASQNVSIFGSTIYGGPCLTIDGTSSVFVYGGTIGPFSVPTNGAGILIASGGLCFCAGVYIYARGSGFAINNSGTFVDGGGNTIANNTQSANVFTGGGVFTKRFSNPVATSANAGNNGDVPSQVLGYQIGSLADGTVIKIPYYAA